MKLIRDLFCALALLIAPIALLNGLARYDRISRKRE